MPDKFLKGRIVQRSDGSYWFYSSVGGPSLPIEQIIREYKDTEVTIEIKRFNYSWLND